MLKTINRGYKFKIIPTREQKEFFLKTFGCARKLYNLYVSDLYEYLKETNYENGYIDKKKINISSYTKYTKIYEYLSKVDSKALCNEKINFENSIKKFNSEHDKKTYTKRSIKRKNTLGIKPTFEDLKGMPKFKSIKNNDFSYKTNNYADRKGNWKTITLLDNQLKLPKLKTTVKVKQHRPLPKDCIIKNCTISMDNKGIFYASLCVEYTINVEPKVIDKNKIIGLDYSQKDFYYSSDNKIANYPHYYGKSEDKLIKLQRNLSRKQSKSNNWRKQKQKITNLHKHIANQRLDWIHKESRKLADNYDVVILEDIDLRNMAQCLKLGKNLHDNGFGMFRTFLKYKLEEQGKQFIKIDKWFPSSKTCNRCGAIKENLLLSDRWFVCECGYENDRDYNASLNIKDCGTRLIAW